MFTRLKDLSSLTKFLLRLAKTGYKVVRGESQYLKQYYGESSILCDLAPRHIFFGVANTDPRSVCQRYYRCQLPTKLITP